MTKNRKAKQSARKLKAELGISLPEAQTRNQRIMANITGRFNPGMLPDNECSASTRVSPLIVARRILGLAEGTIGVITTNGRITGGFLRIHDDRSGDYRSVYTTTRALPRDPDELAKYMHVDDRARLLSISASGITDLGMPMPDRSPREVAQAILDSDSPSLFLQGRTDTGYSDFILILNSNGALAGSGCGPDTTADGYTTWSSELDQALAGNSHRREHLKINQLNGDWADHAAEGDDYYIGSAIDGDDFTVIGQLLPGPCAV